MVLKFQTNFEKPNFKFLYWLVLDLFELILRLTLGIRYKCRKSIVSSCMGMTLGLRLTEHEGLDGGKAGRVFP